MRASKYKVLGIAEYYAEAVEKLRKAGDCVIVERSGAQRQLIVKCPDGCGETLSINLDRRSGPAWRLYKRRGTWSLFPSIDKPTGCNSHFILSRGKIVWCDWWDWHDDQGVEEYLEIVKLYLVDRDSTSFVEIAGQLDADPWDILGACKALVRKGIAEEGRGLLRGHFRLKT